MKLQKTTQLIRQINEISSKVSLFSYELSSRCSYSSTVCATFAATGIQDSQMMSPTDFGIFELLNALLQHLDIDLVW